MRSPSWMWRRLLLGMRILIFKTEGGQGMWSSRVGDAGGM